MPNDECYAFLCSYLVVFRIQTEAHDCNMRISGLSRFNHQRDAYEWYITIPVNVRWMSKQAQLQPVHFFWF